VKKVHRYGISRCCILSCAFIYLDFSQLVCFFWASRSENVETWSKSITFKSLHLHYVLTWIRNNVFFFLSSAAVSISIRRCCNPTAVFHGFDWVHKQVFFLFSNSESKLPKYTASRGLFFFLHWLEHRETCVCVHARGSKNTEETATSRLQHNTVSIKHFYSQFLLSPIQSIP